MVVSTAIPGLACLLRICQNVPTFHNRHSTCCHRLSNKRNTDNESLGNTVCESTYTMVNKKYLTVGFSPMSRIHFHVKAPHTCITFGALSISTKHIRQFPATDSRSWKQKRGICTPTCSQAYGETHYVVMSYHTGTRVCGQSLFLSQEQIINSQQF